MLHPQPGNPFETVTALRILAIDEKGNKTEYSIDPLQPQQTAECVHALFPHNGDPPCWYLKRKFAQPVPMAIFLSVTSQSNRSVLTRGNHWPSLFGNSPPIRRSCGLAVIPD
jgi:hypothetical protein